MCVYVCGEGKRGRESTKVNTKQALHEYWPTVDFASIAYFYKHPLYVHNASSKLIYIGSLVIWTHAYESISQETNWYLNNYELFDQIQNKLSSHTRFNIFTMVLNVCAHHVHNPLICNHSHNIYTMSTYNNTWSTSVHKSQNCLLISKLINIPDFT